LIRVIVIDGELTTDVIHDAWGSRPACFVYVDRRIMDFRRRHGHDEPDAQVIEDGPDHRRVFDAADDPHGVLALRTDQGIDFAYFLNEPRPVPPVRLYIPLWFEDTGNDVIAAFFLPFSPETLL
jgi:hypothetical protein